MHRSDIIDVFFPMVEAFRLRFAGRHPWPLFAELMVDCDGEHTSAVFRDKRKEHGIELIFPSMRKQNMGLAEVTMKHAEMGYDGYQDVSRAGFRSCASWSFG